MSTLGVVIPCHRQERYLPRTLAALTNLPPGWSASGAIVPGEATQVPLAPPGPGWRVLEPDADARRRPQTPGAARMAGLAACAGDWVLFADADIEMRAEWLAGALAIVTSPGLPARLAGLWGRIEEWFVDGSGERPGAPDLLRIGSGERAVDYLAGFALYRRAALLEVGGYDARLSSEEDFELGLRLRARGWELRTLDSVAARHWSEPRPSFAELGRRWSSGLCFGQGQVLRLYAGRPGFGTLLRRQSLYLAMLAIAAAGLAAVALGVMGLGWLPLLGVGAIKLALMAVMSVRKRSVRLAVLSLLTWSLNGLGLVSGALSFDPRRREDAA